MKIVIAEDDEPVRWLMTKALEEAGYRAAAFEDGQAAWEELRDGGADMAVLDVNMPRLDGLELCARIRGDARLKDLPIIMMTIRQSPDDQVSGFDRGADEYLPKPFDPALLVARVKALARRARRQEA